MTEMSIHLTDWQLQGLQHVATEYKASMEDIIKQSIDAWLHLKRPAVLDQEEKMRRILSVAGKYNSGLGDVSENHDHYLAEAYGEHLH